MKKYFIVGSLVAFIVIFNLGYVFHEIIMGNFFREYKWSLTKTAVIFGAMIGFLWDGLQVTGRPVSY